MPAIVAALLRELDHQNGRLRGEADEHEESKLSVDVHRVARDLECGTPIASAFARSSLNSTIGVEQSKEVNAYIALPLCMIRRTSLFAASESSRKLCPATAWSANVTPPESPSP